jgi:hypothetical protein
MTTSSPSTDPYAFLRQPLTGMPPIPGLDQMGATIHEPSAAQRLAPRPAPPERVVYVPGPGGSMVPVLAEHYEATQAVAGSQPDPATAPAPRHDKWPLRMVTGGASTAMVLGVVGHYGPGISQAGHGAEMAGIAVAATAAGVGILVSCVKGALGSKQPINVSVSVTNTNTSRSASSSRSRHTNR